MAPGESPNPKLLVEIEKAKSEAGCKVGGSDRAGRDRRARLGQNGASSSILASRSVSVITPTAYLAWALIQTAHYHLASMMVQFGWMRTRQIGDGCPVRSEALVFIGVVALFGGRADSSMDLEAPSNQSGWQDADSFSQSPSSQMKVA